MAQPKHKHREKLHYSLFISFLAILIALIVGQTTTFTSLEHDLIDYRFKIRGSLDISESPIVILAIDDQSDESTPARWPWPREYFAHVIENLIEAGVKAIGIDVIFEQADYNPGGALSDQKFADVLSQHKNVVLAGKLAVPLGQRDYVSLVPPYELFTKTGVPWGLVSFDLDEDGFYRRYLVGQTYNDHVYGSFAAEVLKVYKDLDPNTEVEDLEDSFKIGPYTIPKINSYSSMINYVGPSGSFPRYSFDAVLDDSDFDSGI